MVIEEELRAFRTERWTVALRTYQEEFRDLLDAWGKLDGKAQGTVTIAGVFLAAVFAAARGDAIPTSHGDRALLGLSILLLVAAVICAGLALRVQAAASGPSGQEIERAAADLDAATSEASDVDAMRIRFLRTQIKCWRESTILFRALNIRKSWYVRGAQLLLFGGIAGALIVTLYLLATSRPN